jgi:hypothetical protein
VCFCLHVHLPSWSKVIHEVKKFFACYKTHRFLTVEYRPLPGPSLDRCIQSTFSHLAHLRSNLTSSFHFVHIMSRKERSKSQNHTSVLICIVSRELIIQHWMAGRCEWFPPPYSSPGKLGVILKLHTGEHILYRYFPGN